MYLYIFIHSIYIYTYIYIGKVDAEGLYTHPPLIPYHSQAHQDHFLNPPYIPSISSVMTQRTAMKSKDSKRYNL
jgi:hypothetical protein